MPVDRFELWEQARSFASSEQDRSQGSAQNEHNSGKPQKQRDATNGKKRDIQNERTDQRERPGAYL